MADSLDRLRERRRELPIDPRLVRRPKIGQTVIIEFLHDGDTYAGSQVAPAIINHVHTDECIDVAVFPRSTTPFPLCSVVRKDSFRSRKAHRESVRAVWSWPERP